MKHLQLNNQPIDEPWVWLEEENDTVHYMGGEEPVESDPVEFVDLGLPSGLLWASCNIGATSPEEYGKYFQWGDTVGYEGDEAKAHSSWSTAPFNGSSSYDETYFASVKNTVCPNGVLAPEYDAATVTYGEGYRMPTKADYDELIVNTTSDWTQVNGVNCVKLTSKNDTSKSIVFPAAGYYKNYSFYYGGIYGSALTSSFELDSDSLVWGLGYASGYLDIIECERFDSFSVRAVKEPNK